MSYALIYTVPFATLDNVPCVVEIEKEGYTGKSKELTPAGDSPFTVDIEDEEFLYTPTRLVQQRSAWLVAITCKVCFLQLIRNIGLRSKRVAQSFGVVS